MNDRLYKVEQNNKHVSNQWMQRNNYQWLMVKSFHFKIMLLHIFTEMLQIKYDPGNAILLQSRKNIRTETWWDICSSLNNILLYKHIHCHINSLSVPLRKNLKEVEYGFEVDN